jgi:hypothetical protein
MKICTHCKQEKSFEAFYPSKRHKSGYAAWCNVCESERSKAKNLLNRDRRLVKAKQWRDENKEKQLAGIQAWRDKNPGRYENIIKDWCKRNKDKVNAKWMKRDAAKKNRTPNWLTDDQLWMIEQAYDIAAKRTLSLGIPFHVDHIVPLQGKTVSGLHVPWNLQVIPAKLNQQKSNRF